MNRYNAFNELPSIVAAPIAFALGDKLINVLVEHGSDVLLAYTLGLFALLVGFFIIKAIANQCFLNASWFRKVCLGDLYVEGTWMNIVKLDNKPIAVGVIRIKSDQNGFRFNIRDYNLEGELSSSSQSSAVFLDWPSVCFNYRTSRNGNQPGKVDGVCVWVFDEHNSGKPTQHHGYFVDINSGTKYEFEGWLEEESKRLSALDSTGGRKELIKDILCYPK